MHSTLAPETASTSTITRGAWARWNGWHWTCAVFLAAYIGYVIYVLGRMSLPIDEAVPRPLNAIVLTALSLGAILTFVAAGLRDGRAREVAREERETARQRAVLDAIAELKKSRAGDTVDLARHGPPRPEGRVVFVAPGTVYRPTGASGSPWSVTRPRPAGDAEDDTTTAIGSGDPAAAPVREAFMHGYQLGKQHKANGVENVLPMPPAHGG